MSKDDGFNEFLIRKAVKAGVKAIIMTVDSTLGGYREEDIATRFQFPLPMPNLAAYGAADGKGKIFLKSTPPPSRTLSLQTSRN